MRRMICAVLAGGLATAAMAGVIHDESIDGDLSDNNAAPSVLTVTPGSNEVIGSLQFSPDVDPDYFRFDVPVGFELTAVILDNYDTTEDQSFMAVQAGNKISDPNTGIGLLGTVLFGGAPGTTQGEDLLDDLGAANLGGDGFSGPLGAGTYTFWVQETAAEVNYALDFQISAIPEPGSLLLLLSMGLLIRRR